MRRTQNEVASELEVGSLQALGVDIRDFFSISEFQIANILGKHFRAGEWGKVRCGSVITCVLEGRSLYARVERFLKVDGDDSPGYASVIWFGVPEYPLGTPLAVRCREAQPDDLVNEFGCIVRLGQIDPSQIMVEREPEGVFCWMMRDSGYDTVPSSSLTN